MDKRSSSRGTVEKRMLVNADFDIEKGFQRMVQQEVFLKLWISKEYTVSSRTVAASKKYSL